LLNYIFILMCPESYVCLRGPSLLLLALSRRGLHLTQEKTHRGSVKVFYDLFNEHICWFEDYFSSRAPSTDGKRGCITLVRNYL
jgi:hypothetical protein